MKINPKDAKQPDGKPGDDRPKKKLEQAFTPNEPSSEGESEVAGRDRRYDTGSGGFIYPNYWHYGWYIWLCDGEAYEGWHWHPNRYSPGAWDVDPC